MGWRSPVACLVCALSFAALSALLLAHPQPLGADVTHSDRASRPLSLDRPIRWAYYFPPDRASLDSMRANHARLDVIAPHWLTMDDQGNLRGTLPSEGRTFLNSVDATILPSVALSSRDAGDRIVGDSTIAAAAIGRLTALATEWDGISLDFEGLDPSSRDGLTQFIRDLGSSVRRTGKLFTVALPAKTSDVRTGWSGAYDLPAIADAADLFLVMAYGFRTSASTEPGSTAPLPWVESTLRYTTKVIAPERLILGVAFYGYDWNTAKGPPARALRHSDVVPLIARVAAVPTLDPRSLSVTFRYEEEGEQHEVWFEDARSLDAKVALAGRYGLRGVGAWRLGQEDPEVWRVWDVALSGDNQTAGSSSRP